MAGRRSGLSNGLHQAGAKRRRWILFDWRTRPEARGEAGREAAPGSWEEMGEQGRRGHSANHGSGQRRRDFGHQCLQELLSYPHYCGGSQYVEEFLEAPGVGSLKSESKRADGRWLLTLREFKKP